MPRKLDHDQLVALIASFQELQQTTRELIERANRAKDLARAERTRALGRRPDGTGRIGEDADVGRSIAADRTGRGETADSLERRRGGRRWTDPGAKVEVSRPALTDEERRAVRVVQRLHDKSDR